jgi:hypothetical protein
MSSLHRANTEVVDALIQNERRRRIGVRRRRPILLIDALLEDLEVLHLSGRHRVPASWESRLRAVEAAVPSRCRQNLPTRVKITTLMDRLYEVQERLLLGQRTFRLLEKYGSREAVASDPCVTAPHEGGDEEESPLLFKSA